MYYYFDLYVIMCRATPIFDRIFKFIELWCKHPLNCMHTEFKLLIGKYINKKIRTLIIQFLLDQFSIYSLLYFIFQI